MAETPFTLTKWYLDCVSSVGDTAILYSATVGWRGITIHYCSLLTANAGQVRTRTSMSRGSVGGDADWINVRLRRLEVEGEWRGRGRPYSAKVYEGNEGIVEWNCLQPQSRVRLRIGDATLEGLGYAECLTMTVLPWRLPMQELRWGRFVSEDHALAWIDWRGPYEEKFAVLDGERCQLTDAGEETIEASGASVRMSDSLPLRTGKVGVTVLPAAPRLRRLLPRALAGIEEHKWRSCGVLHMDGSISRGWAIHEVVHWDLEND